MKESPSLMSIHVHKGVMGHAFVFHTLFYKGHCSDASQVVELMTTVPYEMVPQFIDAFRPKFMPGRFYGQMATSTAYNLHYIQLVSQHRRSCCEHGGLRFHGILSR
jgi:hypothetical protein